MVRGDTAKLVDPIAYFAEEFPEAYEMLPEGPDSLAPEVEMMRHLARDHGLNVAVDAKTNRVFVPEAIVEYVYGAPLKKADIAAYIGTDTFHPIATNPVLHGEVAA